MTLSFVGCHTPTNIALGADIRSSSLQVSSFPQVGKYFAMTPLYPVSEVEGANRNLPNNILSEMTRQACVGPAQVRENEFPKYRTI